MARGKSIIFTNLIGILFYSVSCALIYENRPILMELEKFKNEFKGIQALKSSSKFDFKTYHFQDQKLGTVDLSNIKQLINTVDYNQFSMTLSGDSTEIFRTQNGTITMKYSFSYKTPEGSSDIGFFTIKSHELVITKSYWMLNQTFLLQTANITTLHLEYDDLTFNGKQSLSPLIQKSVSKFLDDSTVNFTEAYNSDIKEYYSSFPMEKKILSFQSSIPNLEFKLDFTYDRKPMIINDKNMIFYYSGQLNNNTISHREPLFPKRDIYQILVNRKIFEDFLNELTSDGVFDFTLTKENLPPNTNFNLDIQSLGFAIPDLYNQFSRSDQLKVWNQIKNPKIMFNDTSACSGIFNLYTEVYQITEMKNILTLKSSFLFKIKHSFNGLQLNFSIDNTVIDIFSLKIGSRSENGPVYINTIKNWLESTIKNYLSSNKYYLLKEPIDLGKFFSIINESSWDVGGFYVTGLSPVFPNYKVNDNSALSSDEYKIIKFLN